MAGTCECGNETSGYIRLRDNIKMYLQEVGCGGMD